MTAYRTIDRLSATLHRARRAIHAGHVGPPATCRETIYIDIKKVSGIV